MTQLIQNQKRVQVNRKQQQQKKDEIKDGLVHSSSVCEKKLVICSEGEQVCDKEKFAKLDLLNTQLSAALLMGIARVAKETEELKSELAETREDDEEAHKKVQYFQNLINKYTKMNEDLLSQNAKFKSQFQTLESNLEAARKEAEELKIELEKEKNLRMEFEAEVLTLAKHLKKQQQQQKNQTQNTTVTATATATATATNQVKKRNNKGTSKTQTAETIRESSRSSRASSTTSSATTTTTQDQYVQILIETPEEVEKLIENELLSLQQETCSTKSYVSSECQTIDDMDSLFEAQTNQNNNNNNNFGSVRPSEKVFSLANYSWMLMCLILSILLFMK